MRVTIYKGMSLDKHNFVETDDKIRLIESLLTSQVEKNITMHMLCCMIRKSVITMRNF